MITRSYNARLKSELIKAAFLIILWFPFTNLASQNKSFTLQNNGNKIIEINKNFNRTEQLEVFADSRPISGLAVSCKVNFESDSSLIRIILIDSQFNEYLVCESYPLLSNSNLATFDEYADESSDLNNIIPYAIKVEITDASIYLKNITTSKKEKFDPKRKAEKNQEQNSEKIKRLNENINKRGGRWIAGETSISKLGYQDKKQLFGGKVPNLQGFEFYKGGLFVIPGAQSPAESIDSIFADEFSWRNRHGQDWVTSVKDQGGCGSCWAFGAIGSTELLINLYYNRHLNLDLSEQDVVSCSGAGNCTGGEAGAALDYIRDFGIVDEECFPYSGWDVPCGQKCTEPGEIIKIGRRENYQFLNDSLAKQMIIKGPVACCLTSWAHILTLVGYKVIREGDNIFNYVIPPGDPYIGRTAWLLKNSWGENWGDNGYLYSVTNLDNLRFNVLFPPVSGLNFKDADITCLDADGDGFYNWGIGLKPSQCPLCPDQPDGDDSNPCIGPMDEYGKYQFSTSLPVTEDVMVMAGDTIPDLKAGGENINWYGDRKKTSLLHTGNSFSPGISGPGTYRYFATQVISGCESDIQPVTLTICLNVQPPVGQNTTLFPGDGGTFLYATGENIKWYSDAKNPLFDARDGQTYKTTLIGNQLWMAENLNYFTSNGSWYYNNDSSTYAKTYGRLYKDANYCPVGWHLPTDEEWIELEVFLGMDRKEAHDQTLRGAGVGSRLKETGTSHWESPNADATNDVNFNALPAGSFNGTEFWGLGQSTLFFALAEYFPGSIYLRNLASTSDKIGRLLENQYSQIAYSIRCISNPSKPISIGNYYQPVYNQPGTYVYYVTQTVSGFESPPDTVVFTILDEVPPPTAESKTVCEKDEIVGLVAKGQNIRWYDDAALKNLVHSGDTFSTGKILPGYYLYYVTQSANDFTSKADTVALKIESIPPAPLSQDIVICENYRDSTLYAAGMNIRWYYEDTLLASGNKLPEKPVNPGSYEFMVTQSNAACESVADTVHLTINPIPDAPLSNDVYMCENQQIPVFTAIGDNIKWYSDSSCINLLQSGGEFTSGITEKGDYQYYVTQTIEDCQSNPKIVELSISGLPQFTLGEDTVIDFNKNLLLGPYNTDYFYEWFDGTTNPYFEISGSDLGYGWHNISVLVIDSNFCTNSDTLAINVVSVTNTEGSLTRGQLLIYPNPANKILNIKFIDFTYGEALLNLVDLNGDEIFNQKIIIDTSETTLSLNISSLLPGTYLLRITSNTRQYFRKIILQ